jgi:Fe-S-cluster containining protein
LALRQDLSADECAGCTGACCENVLVPITGYDAWRVAKSSGLPLAAFSTIATTETGSRGAFWLDEACVALVLRRSLTSPRACYFLGETAPGLKRCTTHPSRPRVCRSYPMRLVDGTVVLRSDVVCRTADWDIDRISQTLWERDLRRETFEGDVYERVLAVWNASDLQGLKVFESFILGSFDSIDAAFSASEASGAAKLVSPSVLEHLDEVTRIANRWIDETRRRIP